MNAGNLYEEISQYLFENAKRKAESRDADRLNSFLRNQRERQRKAEMDKVLWLPGTHPGERF